MTSQGKKFLQAGLIFLAIFSLAIWATNQYIVELPPEERSSAWLWFVAGWVTSAAAVALLLLPFWIRGTIVPDYTPTEEETQANIRHFALMGGALAAFSGSLGVIGPSLAVALGAIGCGSMTAGIGYGIALHTTRKGRAMLDKAKANQ